MANITEVDFSSPARDIPRMLRQFAEEIEQGKLYPKHITAVVYFGEGECDVYGWGGPHLTAHMSYMALDLGKQRIMEMGI